MSKKQYYRDITRTCGCTKVKWMNEQKETFISYILGQYFLHEIIQKPYFYDKKVIETSPVKCQFRLPLNKFIEYADCIELDD